MNRNTSSFQLTLNEKLISGLQRIVNSKFALPLVPLGGNKQPLGDKWQQRPFTANELIEAIAQGGVSVPLAGQTRKIQLQGYGLLTGRPITVEGNTYYLMAVDQDGPSAIDKIAELSKENPLPKTVAFASGREGRCQYLFLVPESYQNSLKTKKIKTGAIGDDGKGEQLEFRWTNLQSVLPPSIHPTTGSYHWLGGCAIDEVDIAIAPDWIIEQMLVERVGNPESEVGRATPLSTYRSPLPRSDIDYALSYLNALSSFRVDDYDQWLAVGMALHSVDDSLLDEWDRWSNQSGKYKSGDCHRKWRSFCTSGGVKLGTLAHMAKLDGWQSPFTNYRQISGFDHGIPSTTSREAVLYTPSADGWQGKVDQNETKVKARENSVNNNKSNQISEGSTNFEGRDEIKIRELLLSILQQNLSASAQTEALNTLSASWGWSVRELRTLLEQIETDLERKDNHSEHQQQLQQLATYKQSCLNLDLYLPESIAKPITKVANWMEAPTAAYLVVLLSAVASCCDPRTRIIVKESSNFIEP
ncbi:MAG: bifunctional DNA primase/polymerase, partial [Waterburya sp.]